MQATKKKLLSAKETEAKLQVSDETRVRWWRQRILVPVAKGKTVIGYDPAAVEDLLQKIRVAGLVRRKPGRKTGYRKPRPATTAAPNNAAIK